MRPYDYYTLNWSHLKFYNYLFSEPMNITRLNYSQTLPLIQRAIQESHFLSFDLEMSGILTQELTSPSIIDSMQIRYQKQRQSINKFIPLQFGLSAFRVDPYHNKVWISPFNFYIFPLSLGNDTMKFSFHAGTMNFLIKNNFDFNSLFYESIPYVSKNRIDKFKKDQEAADFKRQLRKTKMLQSPQTKAFVSLQLPLVQQWFSADSQVLQIDINMIKYQSYMVLKQKIEELHPDSYFQFDFDNDLVYRRTKMIIRKCNSQKPSKEIEMSSQSSQDLLFNKVVDQMVLARRPLIVHNGFLDLMHIYYRFFNDLPQEWNSYRMKVNQLFPAIYDNKYLFANSPTLSSKTEGRLTSLESCYLGVRKYQEQNKDKIYNRLMKFQIDPDFRQYQLDNLECHQAGFDSLMTGYSFLRGVTLLNNNPSLLTNQKVFTQEHTLIRNRIPQGSIKVPFNLQNDGNDIYSKDGNQPIHFKSVLREAASQQAIQEYFSRTFGAINFLWTVRDMTEFCIIFLSEKDQKNFQNYLQKQLGRSSSVIFQIGEVRYLILSNMEQHQLMKKTIKGENEEEEEKEIQKQ